MNESVLYMGWIKGIDSFLKKQRGNKQSLKNQLYQEVNNAFHFEMEFVMSLLREERVSDVTFFKKMKELQHVERKIKNYIDECIT